MSGIRFVLVLAVGLFCAAPRASAIIIELANRDRVKGFLKKDDGEKLWIGHTPDRHEKGTPYVRASVTVIHELNVRALGALSKDKPEGYFKYAEELARKPEAKDDPEAAYFAKRLYLLAACLDRANYGRASLLGMGELAGTPPEARRRYRAMAFVLDPKADPKLLKDDPVSAARPDKSDAAALECFIKALQFYREGEIRKARDAANQAGVVKIFAMANVDMDRVKFMGWCDDAYCKNCRNKRGVSTGQIRCPNCRGSGIALGRLCGTCKGNGIVPCPECHGTPLRPRPPECIRTVLRAELWALGQGEAGDEQQTSHPKSWSEVLQSSPVLPLNFDTLIDFDPRKCRYIDGEWVE
jgi:hypothetical protein